MRNGFAFTVYGISVLMWIKYYRKSIYTNNVYTNRKNIQKFFCCSNSFTKILIKVSK